MHDIIFENQKTLEAEHIFLFAGQLGLDIERFKNTIQQQSLSRWKKILKVASEAG